MTRLIGLLFYRRSDGEGSTTTLFPLFWRFWDAPTGATATALFPLYEHRSGPRDDTTVVGPVYWRSFKNGGWGAGLLPIAYFGQNAGRSHGVVFPLFWRVADARAATTVLFPLFYWRSQPRGYAGGILPLLLFFGRTARAGTRFSSRCSSRWPTRAPGPAPPSRRWVSSSATRTAPASRSAPSCR